MRSRANLAREPPDLDFDWPGRVLLAEIRGAAVSNG